MACHEQLEVRLRWLQKTCTHTGHSVCNLPKLLQFWCRFSMVRIPFFDELFVVKERMWWKSYGEAVGSQCHIRMYILSF